ncbi:methyltransferase [Flammeovirgaceae bacterium SG7u.111]|nr:methyltransferase [Flammeovirgaceae bacterium SG7u.132]WPO37400.1 methyltransferase [Flammeovirgaceae bacterium SG7u.111]
MANSYFQFKQFRLEQALAGMKFGTDSAVLGAWANHPDPSAILDIGTGTGILALMLAQRFTCPIHAVEIEPEASAQATSNFKNSPWATRLNVYQQDIKTFEGENKYDLIVSNPPYFHRSLASPDQKRQLARHSDSLSTQTLLKKADSLLGEQGLFYVVVPSLSANEYETLTAKLNLFLQEKLAIVTVEGKNPARYVLKFGRKKTPHQQKVLIVKNKTGDYTVAYAQLLKDYFLIF